MQKIQSSVIDIFNKTFIPNIFLSTNHFIVHIYWRLSGLVYGVSVYFFYFLSSVVFRHSYFAAISAEFLCVRGSTLIESSDCAVRVHLWGISKTYLFCYDCDRCNPSWRGVFNCVTTAFNQGTAGENVNHSVVVAVFSTFKVHPLSYFLNQNTVTTTT